MIEWESSCVGCERCMGMSCPNYYDHPVLRCDVCGDTADELWEDDGTQMCEYCLADHAKEIFKKVEVEDENRRS